jgi:hypothetical protein
MSIHEEMKLLRAEPTDAAFAEDLLVRGEKLWRRLDPDVEDQVGTLMASKWIAEAMQFIREAK